MELTTCFSGGGACSVRLHFAYEGSANSIIFVCLSRHDLKIAVFSYGFQFLYMLDEVLAVCQTILLVSQEHPCTKRNRPHSRRSSMKGIHRGNSIFPNRLPPA